MPELPEVETIKRGLSLKIKGKIISDVLVFDKKTLNVPEQEFFEAVKNAKIKNIERRAKNLIISLSNNQCLLIHLKMTGQLIYKRELSKDSAGPGLKNEKYKHTRAIFFFKDGGALVFNDLRKFGYIKLIAKEKMEDFIGKKKLGIEPLTDDFTINEFKGILKKHPRRKIKQLLTDQTLIAGIGNIYSDEICAYAKISPLRAASELAEKEIPFLYEGIVKILAEAVRLRGTSVGDYLDACGEKGGYAAQLAVYGRKGEKCRFCGEKIKRIKINGRSSCYCPNCQK